MPFVGRDEEIESLAEGLTRAGLGGRVPVPQVLVLHGPPGVGKTALAAALVMRPELPRVHWIPVGAFANTETTLLRLLAEHGAPRREIVAAALKGEEEFQRVLRAQCARFIRGSVVVLDVLDKGRPALGRNLLAVLGNRRNLVIVTGREASDWGDLGARLHAVGPLGPADAARLVEAVAAAKHARSALAPASAHRQAVDAAQGLPALLRVAGAQLAFGDPFSGISTPDALVTRVLDLWDYLADERAVLEKLAFREPNGPFTSRTVEALFPERDSAWAAVTLDMLAAFEVVQETGDGVFVLPSQIATAIRNRVPTGSHPSHATAVASQLLQAVGKRVRDAADALDGRHRPSPHSQSSGQRTPDELARSADEFMALLSDSPPSSREMHLQGTTHLTGALASVFTVYGDAHRLVALLRLIRRPSPGLLSEAARDLGMPQEARELLGRVGRDTSYEAAPAWYSSGDLQQALRTSSNARVQQIAYRPGWLTVRGAALCDQGRPLEAVQVLEEAHTAHRGTGCTRGCGWAQLHHARACLLLGRAAEAEHLLGQAAEAFRSVGDVRGENWVATEKIRLLLLHGREGDALDVARRALIAHERSEDIRGMGWTCHYLGLAHARRGSEEDARSALRFAGGHFRDCADELGSAWTRHRLAVLTSEGGSVDELEAVATEFADLGCTLGQAWSLLEVALRSPQVSSFDDAVTLAEELFRDLGDLNGLTWANTLRDMRRRPTEYLVLESSSSRLGSAYLSSCLWEFGNSVNQRRPAIPLRARDLVAVHRDHEEPEPEPELPPLVQHPWVGLPPALPASPRRNTPHCRVRITLLDDSPTTSATARLLLRVTPTQDHPWSAHAEAGTPWLTATAVPLTPASVEPATALLRPAEQAAHGGEFTFTAHRPGRHVIRFTVALERTGTVLQQVETELDILDGDHLRDLAGPRAASTTER
ncbi:AAA family ATPase [Streptomyces sp. HC44]|uniref:AAA family ATPase n=1 Tax=Streptomyces scabichelini TaxID=2711217 RepID=A0A6G4V433_9ACTN|nr:AAA family ATPase [Streptomyces scabichelini]